MISAQDNYSRKHVTVNGLEMTCIDEGQGDPIVFLHGNPTSSYLWRNIIPHTESLGRCVAPDLIGMGQSAKLPGSDASRYTFAEHTRYLDELLAQLNVNSNVTLVVHDWGSALGFHWASRHPESVKALVYMEAIVCPVTWDEWPEPARAIFQSFRSPAGESMILEKNLFVEAVLPNAIIRDLGEEEMAAYRKPFNNIGEDRRPTLTWPREIPLDGEPTAMIRIVEGYMKWLDTSQVPKLFINAEPGSILTGRQRDYCRGWPNQQEVTVKGSHFIQEDSPDEIGEAIAEFLQNLS